MPTEVVARTEGSLPHLVVGHLVGVVRIAIDDGQGDSYGDLYFTGVPADTSVTANVTGPSGTTCQVYEDVGTTYPIKAKSITVVYAYCQ